MQQSHSPSHNSGFTLIMLYRVYTWLSAALISLMLAGVGPIAVHDRLIAHCSFNGWQNGYGSFLDVFQKLQGSRCPPTGLQRVPQTTSHTHKAPSLDCSLSFLDLRRSKASKVPKPQERRRKFVALVRRDSCVRDEPPHHTGRNLAKSLSLSYYPHPKPPTRGRCEKEKFYNSNRTSSIRSFYFGMVTYSL